jgi:hypothetical protein
VYEIVVGGRLYAHVYEGVSDIDRCTVGVVNGGGGGGIGGGLFVLGNFV